MTHPADQIITRWYSTVECAVCGQEEGLHRPEDGACPVPPAWDCDRLRGFHPIDRFEETE